MNFFGCYLSRSSPNTAAHPQPGPACVRLCNTLLHILLLYTWLELTAPVLTSPPSNQSQPWRERGAAPLASPPPPTYSTPPLGRIRSVHSLSLPTLSTHNQVFSYSLIIRDAEEIHLSHMMKHAYPLHWPGGPDHLHFRNDLQGLRHRSSPSCHPTSVKPVSSEREKGSGGRVREVASFNKA